MSPVIFLFALFCFTLVLLQYFNMRERSELTKKLMARDLTEYQQESLQKEVFKHKRTVEPKKDPMLDYIPLSDLENDPESLSSVHNYVSKLTNK